MSTQTSLSLRTFHLFFVLCAMLAMDAFGAWGLWQYNRGGEGSMLLLGILGLVTGLAIAGYGLFALRKFDSEGIA